MADFAITYGKEEGWPVFVITAQCGHTYLARRNPPDCTIEDFVRMHGEVEQCPPCLTEGVQTILEELDYQLNPDTESLGWSRLANAITVEETVIGQSAEQRDAQPNREETGITKGATGERIYMVRAQIDLDALAEYMQYREEHELDYIMSCLMKECFGRDLIPSTFCTMLDSNDLPLHFLAYGSANAEQMQRAHRNHLDDIRYDSHSSRYANLPTPGFSKMPGERRARSLAASPPTAPGGRAGDGAYLAR